MQDFASHGVARNGVARNVVARKVAVGGCLMALLAIPTFADEPFFSASAEAERFTAEVEVRGLEQPILTLSNEAGLEPARIEVVALDEVDHQHRRHTVVLEVGGQSVLGFDSIGGFDRLILNGDREFTAALEDAAGGEMKALRVSSSRNTPLGAAKAALAQCDADWNLTCISPSGCTASSGYKPGRVESFNQVYWNLHTPTGPWTTIGSGCNTTWYGADNNGCPGFAYNCWGQTYSVDHPFPDLIITNVSLNKSTVTSGGDVVVSYTVKNVGDILVTARYRENFYLKPGSGSASLLHTSSTYGQDIPPGGSVALVETVTVSAAAGSYTFQVEGDGGFVIPESNESNNITGIPITVTAPPAPQLTLHDLIYNPGSGNGWTYALENCPQGSLCTRTFEVESTGGSSAYVSIGDQSDSYTTVTNNCPTYLSPGNSCYITIKHTLPSGTAKRNGGYLQIPGATPSQSSYKICISDDATLCR